MDNEAGIWCVKDFKCNNGTDAEQFWEITLSTGLDIYEGWF